MFLKLVHILVMLLSMIVKLNRSLWGSMMLTILHLNFIFYLSQHLNPSCFLLFVSKLATVHTTAVILCIQCTITYVHIGTITYVHIGTITYVHIGTITYVHIGTITYVHIGTITYVHIGTITYVHIGISSYIPSYIYMYIAS